MQVFKETYFGAENREALVDFTIPDNFNHNIIVFIHGYMGFKDWGAWSLMEFYFVDKGYGFCKFNISHNGTTIEFPKEFVDLDAFSKNRYSFELKDVQCVLNWLESKIDLSKNTIHLIGHSRGGGISLLSAGDKRIASVITMAAISSIEKRFNFSPEVIKDWKKSGLRFVTNSRTKQEMPHSIDQLYDYHTNKNSLNIEDSCLKLNKPLLVLHGDQDESVSISEGEEIARWSNQKLTIINGANHTFGAVHPYTNGALPEHLALCCEKINDFLRTQFIFIN